MNHLKAIDKIEHRAAAEVDKVIEQARLDLIIPYCNRYGMRFTAGMGSWSFDKKGQYLGDWLDRADFPRMSNALWEFLRAPYPFNRMNDLGSMTPDYTPLNWKGD